MDGGREPGDLGESGRPATTDPAITEEEEALLARIVALLDGRDRLVDQPSRLAILTRLRSCPEGEGRPYRELLRTTGLSAANLSAHLRKLEDAGYVERSGRFVDTGGRRPSPRRFVRLTPEGHGALEAHWEAMLEVSRLSARGLGEKGGITDGPYRGPAAGDEDTSSSR